MDISGNNFTGSVPSSWSALTNLMYVPVLKSDLGYRIFSLDSLFTLPSNIRGTGRYLDASGNHLAGTFPSATFNAMTSLRYLNLCGNWLSGTVPSAFALVGSASLQSLPQYVLNFPASRDSIHFGVGHY